VADQLPLFSEAEPSEVRRARPDTLPGASSRLIEELARICAEHPLEEKVLVAPSLAIGHQTVERVGREIGAWTNLRVETIRTLAHAVVGPELAREGRRLLSRAQALALVEQACSEKLSEGSYFGELRDRPGFHRALQSSLEELRAAGIGPRSLPAGAFPDGRKHRELTAILDRYAAALEEGRYADSLEVLRRAAAAVESGETSHRTEILILPEGAELSGLERRFLEKLGGKRLLVLPTDPPAHWVRAAAGARLLRALGEENEIREVFREVLASGLPYDEVEILHTDPSTYPSLIYELAREHEIPCTFAAGIAVTYTRPGQAALAFLDWIGEGFAADRLREALSSRVLSLRRSLGQDPADEKGSGAQAVARAFREARIGWGRSRHLRCLDRLVARLEEPQEPSRRDDEATEEQRKRRAEGRLRRLEAARRARRFALRALELAPQSPEARVDLRALSRGIRLFVAEFARVAGELDGTASKALEKLFQEMEELIPLRLTLSSAVERLRDAVAALSIAADRPRPGRVHVAFYRAGGFSGRRHTFLLGLDEARHPGRDLEEPVLLDEERRRINDSLVGAALALGRERPRGATTALAACLARLRGSLTASYSCFDLRNLSQAGEPAPSSFFLALYRETSGRPTADYADLAAALSAVARFAPEADRALADTEWWLRRVREAGTGGGRDAAGAVLRVLYPWLADGERAQAARESDEFTEYDGWVRSGTPELDPRSSGEPLSVTRIQLLARCPFAYFVQQVLHVEPPEDLEVDPTRWLSALDEGTLLHEVFRLFFEQITEAGEKPDLARHLPKIEAIAEETIAQWRERIPPRSEVAFGIQRSNILTACRTLLREEAAHCCEVTPRFFEVPFGLPREVRASKAALASADPVEIDLDGGRSFLLRGSIDRVDEAPDGTFHVWDYKTGGTGSVREGAGLRGGRQVQFALYAMALEKLLERAGTPRRVTRSGYFFPGRKGEGQRMAMAVELEATRDVLRRLFDLMSSGMFPHAPSPEDCRFCELETVCGGAESAGARARAKLEGSGLAALAAFKEIHEAGS
jgi:ATP-dependent helicase/nuclease subunit B